MQNSGLLSQGIHYQYLLKKGIRYIEQSFEKTQHIRFLFFFNLLGIYFLQI